MDEQTTTVRSPERTRPARPAPPRAVRFRSDEPHHRRRRGLAIGALALVSLIVGISAGAGGGGANRRSASPPEGYFGRIEVLAGDGLGSFAAQQRAAENAAIDRTLAYAPVVQIAGAQHKEIALTFDDGPGPYTTKVLEILAQQSVPATFFQVGNLVQYFQAATAAILSRGYPIGDHTLTHAPMTKLSLGDQERQLIGEVSATGNAGAPFPRMFRPPYGLYNATTLQLARKYKMLTVMWTIDTEDYRRPGSQTIANRVLRAVQPGAIVLMHDGGGPRQETVDALPQIITTLRGRGYKLVTVPRLLLDNPAPANQQLPTSTAGSGG